MSALATELSLNGFATPQNVCSQSTLDLLGKLTDKAHQPTGRRLGGLRSPFEVIPDLLEVLRTTGLAPLMLSVCDSKPSLVRAILFDKTPQANWLVQWHRDTTIAVAQRHEVDGFGPWSIKDGVVQVRPPNEVLDSMVTARLHLDDCPENNGPLRVMPRSHKDLSIEPDEHQAVTCVARAGDVALMKPLVLHASAKSQGGSRRRVLHMEFSADDLPVPLCWHERLSI